MVLALYLGLLWLKSQWWPSVRCVPLGERKMLSHVSRRSWAGLKWEASDSWSKNSKEIGEWILVVVLNTSLKKSRVEPKIQKMESEFLLLEIWCFFCLSDDNWWLFKPKVQVHYTNSILRFIKAQQLLNEPSAAQYLIATSQLYNNLVCNCLRREKFRLFIIKNYSLYYDIIHDLIFL